MTYEEARAYIDSLHGAGILPGLRRMEQVMEALGHPERSLKTVHIAGTNGKGSTAAMLRAMLTAAGYRVGAYTSPAVTGLRDTITMDGKPIGKQAFADCAAAVREAMPQGLSEFEYITALSFLWFSRMDAGACVIECGLGGREDATNVLPPPLCAVLTPISLDHQAFLGDTVAAIAREKAGICKPPCPIVCAPSMPAEALAVVMEHAAANGQTVSVPQASAAPIVSVTAEGTAFSYGGTTYRTPLTGAHQRDNALTALLAAEELTKAGFVIPETAKREGLARASLPCRQEICHKDPLVMLDGSHNPDGAAALRDTLTRLTDRPVTLICGMLRDKDAVSYAATLAPLCARVLCCTPASDRALPAGQLAKIFAAQGVPTAVFPTPAHAYREALAKAQFPLVCGGSFYTVSPLRPLMLDRRP